MRAKEAYRISEESLIKNKINLILEELYKDIEKRAKEAKKDLRINLEDRTTAEYKKYMCLKDPRYYNEVINTLEYMGYTVGSIVGRETLVISWNTIKQKELGEYTSKFRPIKITEENLEIIQKMVHDYHKIK